MGLCGALLACAALWTFVYAIMRNFTWDPMTGGGTALGRHPLDAVLAFGAAPALAVGGAILLAWALGVGGWRAPLVAVAAVAAGVPLGAHLTLYVHLPTSEDFYVLVPLEVTESSLTVVPLVLVLAFLVRGPVRWRALLAPGALASAAVVVAATVPNAGVVIAAGAALWVLVPAVSALRRHR